LVLLISTFFLFFSLVTICDLPSFPTRRSSDLGIHNRARLGQSFCCQPRICRRGTAQFDQQRDDRRSTKPARRIEMTTGGADSFRDRKSTRLNSSHVAISYAVFCLKKKIKTTRV